MKKLFEYYGDANIGFYGRASDKFFVSCFDENFSDILNVASLKTTIGGTEFVGLFSALNSNGIILPFIVREEELKNFKELKVNVLILKEKFTAIGNLIVANDKGAIVSELISKKNLKAIEDVLGVEVIQASLANSKVVGSVCFATNKGAILHREASEDDERIVKDVLKVEVEKGSVNFGSPFVASGLIANSYGALIGSKTSGYELDIILRALKV
ncbi:MAG: translation initiation factor IF-6 [Candidatus Aenigmarchaeota archaeon]|jgi:translation initiation factor 6|nr:translation initiation factor IF-6 [Candidatus Aenigmarchaeota archaeon]